MMVKKEHAGTFSQMNLKVGIHSHIYYWANDTSRICVKAKKNTEKQIKKLDNLKGSKQKYQENNYILGRGLSTVR